ncbi:hypothetical protein [Haloferax mucosum]|nr:hypothetical protein [Haloferax mucosum]
MDSPARVAVADIAVMVAAAKSGVSASTLPILLGSVQVFLDARTDEYARAFECIHRDAGTAVYFVPLGHWDTKGVALGLSHREVDAVRRAHAEHLRHVGVELNRREEFETALEIREVAVVSTD